MDLIKTPDAMRLMAEQLLSDRPCLDSANELAVFEPLIGAWQLAITDFPETAREERCTGTWTFA